MRTVTSKPGQASILLQKRPLPALTLRSQCTWGGYVVLHLEKGLMAALLQGGYCRSMAGPMQWDAIYAEQPVTHL